MQKEGTAVRRAELFAMNYVFKVRYVCEIGTNTPPASVRLIPELFYFIPQPMNEEEVEKLRSFSFGSLQRDIKAVLVRTSLGFIVLYITCGVLVTCSLGWLVKFVGYQFQLGKAWLARN